jgi:hypothetical protein
MDLFGERQLYDKDIPDIIRSFESLIGHDLIRKKIIKYKTIISDSKNKRPIYTENYLKIRHPWMKTLHAIKFHKNFDFDKIKKNESLLYELYKVASDFNMILKIKETMNKKIWNTFKSNLFDDDNAKSYLFEICIADHYYCRGCNVKWHELENTNHTEFIVFCGDTTFEVECKTLHIDSFRHIKEQKFYDICDIIIPYMKKNKIHGNIDIVLKDKLHEHKFIEIISDQIKYQIDEFLQNRDKINLYKDTDDVCIKSKLFYNNNIVTNFNKVVNEFKSIKSHQSIGVIYSDRIQHLNDFGTNNIKIMCKSEKDDEILKRLREVLSNKIKQQFKKDIPGIICCYIPDISDFSSLVDQSGLKFMTHDIFNSEKADHIACIMYTSDPIIDDRFYGKYFYRQSLYWSNPNCKFDRIKDYDFFDKM